MLQGEFPGQGQTIFLNFLYGFIGQPGKLAGMRCQHQRPRATSRQQVGLALQHIEGIGVQDDRLT